MSEKAKFYQRKRQKKEKYENEPKFEYVVIGMFSRRVVNWLYRQFENVEAVQCEDDPNFCRQVREAIANNTKKHIQEMRQIDTGEGE